MRTKNVRKSVNFKQIILFYIGLTLSSFLLSAQDYIPPIGIPAPEFGINETVENVYGSDTLYTHYIDNTNSTATDTDNPNGSREKPRMTIPSSLPVGSIVEIHGGPYNYIGGTYTMNGTVEAPVFIRGVSDSLKPSIRRSSMSFSGQYFIVEDLEFYDQSVIRFSTSAKYGSLRNCEVHNPVGQTGASNPTINVTGEHMVIYHCEIHDNVREAEIDCHGIQAGNYGKKIWVLDNNIYNNGGDGIQACHQCNPGPRYLYIGRNRFHHDKENGIDLKYATDVIISENILYDYMHSATTGIVSPIVVGSDGAPTRVWILFNELYEARKGIRIEEINDLWIIGNVIHDINEAGIIPEKVGTRTRVINNTLYNMQNGISDPWRETFSLFIYNNIFASISGTSIKLGSSIAVKSEIANNLFWETTSHGENQVNADPLFTDAANLVFSLQETSPAIDAGVARGSEYYEFQTMYGVDIQRDYNGEIRPQGNDWDIGAFEYPTGTFPVQHQLNVEFDEAEGSVTPTGGIYTVGTTVKLSAVPKTDYIFDTWAGDLSGSENPGYITMDGDKTVSALFKALTQYTLSVHVSGKGMVLLSPDSALYSPGKVVTLRAIPDTGEQFVEWRGDLTGTENPQQITMTANKGVTAVFTSPVTDGFLITALEPQTGKFEATWDAYATADQVDGVIGFSQESPLTYDDLSCKILFTNTGDITVSNGSTYTSDVQVPYIANQFFTFRMSVDIEMQIYSLWVTPEGETEILLADTYAFHPAPGTITAINYRSVKMSFDPQWGGAEGMVEISNFNVVTDIADERNSPILPGEYSLSSYPNPFNPTTIIICDLPLAGEINLSIYNALGQKVETLMTGRQNAGRHQLSWDAAGYAAGIYISRLEISGQRVISNKMILLR
jgi:hypothetical protein